MLTFTPVSVVFNIILSLSIVTEVQAVLPHEPTTRDDFLQCEFDTNTAWTLVTIERERIILETTLTGVNVNITSTFCFYDGSTFVFCC